MDHCWLQAKSNFCSCSFHPQLLVPLTNVQIDWFIIFIHLPSILSGYYYIIFTSLRPLPLLAHQLWIYMIRCILVWIRDYFLVWCSQSRWIQYPVWYAFLSSWIHSLADLIVTSTCSLSSWQGQLRVRQLELLACSLVGHGTLGCRDHLSIHIQ